MTHAPVMGLRQVVMCAAVSMVAACGSDPTDAASTSELSGTEIPPTTAVCGDISKIKNSVSEFSVTDISIVGQCTTVIIATTLASDRSGAETALQICTAAAAVAYADDVSSVAVSGASRSELAVGIKGASCIGN